MTPDELRALADALIDYGEDAWPTVPEPIRDAADYLRAQADAQPVPAVPAIEERGPWSANRQGRQVWIESGDFTHDVCLIVRGDFESHDQRFAYAQEIARRLNAAPAAPQAEPIDPHMIVAEDRFPDEQAEPSDDNEQAEPKREPLDDDEISRLAWQQNVWTDGMIEFSFLAFARAVERAHGISGGGHD